MSDRLAVLKTYKLFVGGKFPRSEGGRVYEVAAESGEWLGNAPLGTRKDVRDAVAAARKGFGGWAAATAYNRGQVLYRVAEMLETRGTLGGEDVAAAVDRLVWYAGWTDKLAQVAGSMNPVAGPYWNVSRPEPCGVVGVLAPPRGGLLGLVSVLAPVLAAGNAAVVVPAEGAPLGALELGEVLGVSDVPAGVVNVVSGPVAQLAPVLAAHADVDGVDLTGAAPEAVAELEGLAAGTLKRVWRGDPAEAWGADPGTARLLAFTELKTVWHPASW
ncbi:aldehyde dehydrogenase [Mangrovactinospora gilvigrisea]|uniref:Aldehyde dehydrogenase n=1 Tax=Mangrovactinospora gilvigrisea TaxID=1428644 RepID=A0A1J7BJ13_9ACTN|nr:aldehyde dehydrogenase family protein [Mangrovactinospora gilvigrisea]OIV38573.1 aldehyde dehydrogenase [Mangrovactinospora gilvigrisea]